MQRAKARSPVRKAETPVRMASGQMDGIRSLEVEVGTEFGRLFKNRFGDVKKADLGGS